MFLPIGGCPIRMNSWSVLDRAADRANHIKTAHPYQNSDTIDT